MKHLSTALAFVFAITVNAQVNYYNTTTNGTNASAIGENSDADGVNAFAGGVNSKAQGQTSFAFGTSAEGNATGAIALGLSTKSNGVASLTLGSNISADGTNSFVIGKGITSGYRLINGIPNSLMIGMNATKPTLFISQTYGLDKTGKVAIGNMTDPQAKLHIKADDNEDASILLEATGSNISKIEFGNASNRIHAKTDSSLNFHAAKLFRFTNGDVFIDDIGKGIIMKSPDGQCWRGVLDNYGNLNFTSVDCNIITTSQKEMVPKKYKVSVFPNPAKDRLTVEVADLSHSPIIQLFTMEGELMFSERITQAQKHINTSSFPPGSYVIHIIEANKNILFEQKLILW